MSEEEPASIPLSDLRSEIDEDERRAEDGDDGVPLSELRDAVEQDRGGEREPFVEEDVESVDSEGVWADLLMEDAQEGQFAPAESDGETQVISKRICERCPFVAAPPELACTHDGTTIHELVDVDHVRVSACPMVGPDGEQRSVDVD